ncbi:MAG: hypothetical protein HRU69_11340 [Flammeovirgaceae bacterium]|nr:MAG: hypothetical protein HRU69_11340 [Flammeovirgaceae bacterium]
MIVMLKLIVPILLLLINISCRVNPEIAKRIELDGLNGRCYYFFSRDNRNIIRVAKIEYLKYICCDVTINSDTILIGEKFIADISVTGRDFKAFITEPSQDTITGKFEPSELPQKTKAYYFEPTVPGLFNFKCRIEYDTISIPFEYKFLVLPK